MREAGGEVPGREAGGGGEGFSYLRSMERLVEVVRQLSAVRDLEGLMAVVRTAARGLTGADGATFVLRDGDLCHYADEDAIAPLWKGRRFPMSACISGWAMLHREAVAIEDIYADDRIPADAYRPTFVKSLVMVPIRGPDPVGAIGNYWARRHAATPEQVRLLQALADSASVAMENVRLYAEMEGRVRVRTAELAEANRDLEAFSYSVSHDLRAPLRAIEGFSRILGEDHAGSLDAEGRRCLDVIVGNTGRMGRLIDDLLEFSRAGRAAIERVPVDMGEAARTVFAELRAAEPDREVEFRIAAVPPAEGDPALLRQVLVNLLSNALKFTRGRSPAIVELGAEEGDGEVGYFVRDNGAGFDMRYAPRLFGVFQRLHRQEEFEGTGVGLALVQRIVQRHGGRVEADGREGAGATFRFVLPRGRGPAPGAGRA